jgi:cytochrome c-type biogenesis protein CcmH/NrfF
MTTLMKKPFQKPQKFTRNLVLIVVLLGSPTIMRGAQNDHQEDAEKHLWCPCGCNQGLNACNHIGCPSAPPMRGEVTEYLDEGLDVDAVLTRFEDKYGPTILTAPSTEGWFDLSAWLMPFAGLLAGLGGVSVFARRFRNRWSSAQGEKAELDTAAMDTYQKRIEDELVDFTPED